MPHPANKSFPVTEVDDQRSTPDERIAAPEVPEAPSLPSGTMIGGFRIEDRIGLGGMGEVYRATQLSMDRAVALKVLSPRFAMDSQFRQRFMAEARHTGRLAHPHLITVFDTVEQELGEKGMQITLAYAMELVLGRALADVIVEQGNISEQACIRYLLPVLDALAYVHDQGLLHRDIKPDNIMIAEDGTVKLADMGLACVLDDDNQRMTNSGVMMGTPAYMAPEQARDARHVDARADIYAVGATMYHALSGHPPFDGTSPVDIVLNATSKPLVMPEQPLSPGMRKILKQCLQPDADKRLAEVSELHRQLSELAEGGFKQGVPPWGIVAGLAMVIVFLVALLWPQGVNESEPEQSSPIHPESESSQLDNSSGLSVVNGEDSPLLPSEAPESEPETAVTPSGSPEARPLPDALNDGLRRIIEFTAPPQLQQVGLGRYRLKGTNKLILTRRNLSQAGSARIILTSMGERALFSIRVPQEAGDPLGLSFISIDDNGIQQDVLIPKPAEFQRDARRRDVGRDGRDGESTPRKKMERFLEQLRELVADGQKVDERVIDLSWNQQQITLSAGSISQTIDYRDTVFEMQWMTKVNKTRSADGVRRKPGSIELLITRPD